MYVTIGLLLAILAGGECRALKQDQPWYSNAIVYQLYPRSFQDTNGNGVGDLNGIIQHVDYLSELGIDAIWLNPIYTSPGKDFGYDISNFEDIDQLFGSLNDFDNLVKALKAKGIKVIMDFVPNHSLNEHPWFLKSVKSEGVYKNYYVWTGGKVGADGQSVPPNNWMYVTIGLLLAILAGGECRALKQDQPWYSNAIVYQLYPRSFQDTNGNGVGDLNGIIQHVDYLSELGIDAIWLNPIYTSPGKDFGYDISNFEDIDQLFGSLNDFDNLVKALKAKGIKVIMDFVPNHSLNEHPWFLKSVKSEGVYKNYYVWTGGKVGADGQSVPPNNWTSMFGGSMWTYVKERNQYYLHQFLEQQPDLDYRNPAVQEEMDNVLRFWMDRGVDGFRMDAVSSLVENLSLQDEPFIGPDPNNYGEYIHTMTIEQPETFDVLQHFMEVLNNYTTQRGIEPKLVMTENYNKNYDIIRKYFGTQDKPRSTFPINMFWIMFNSIGSNAGQWAETIDNWNKKAMPDGNWATANWVMYVAIGLLLAILAGGECRALKQDQPWYSNAIVYQLYPRSFQDTNGNGVGDLNGIIQHVDYLSELGIDAIWLNPIYTSPGKDFGYDISNFEDIDQLFGSLNDFDNLVKALKAKGIKVIMDFVPNHSSNEHPWFLKSVKSEGVYKNYYVWTGGKVGADGQSVPPNNWTSMFGGSMWTYVKERNQYYLHQFLEQQPDLDYRNPAVQEEMDNVLRFWMDRGVDGFRMDAVSSLVENLSLQDEPFIGPDPNNYGEYIHTMTIEQPETFDVLQHFMEVLNNYTTQRGIEPKLVMTENYNKNYDIIRKYFGTQDKPRSTFPINMFWIMFNSIGSNASQWAETIDNWNKKAMPDGNWATANWVLGNHDQLRVSSRFTPEHTDVLNMMQLSLKGVAVVYYGDEMGLLDSLVRRDQTVDPQGLRASPEDFSWRNRDPCRGPMPWTDAINGNFTTGKPWLPLAPDYWVNNVAHQLASPRSHLNVFRKMAKLRKTPPFLYGDSFVTYASQSLIIHRSLVNNPSYVTVLNLGFSTDVVDLKKAITSLPGKLKILVASINYPMSDDLKSPERIVSSSQITLPPISGFVLSTSLDAEVTL